MRVNRQPLPEVSSKIPDIEIVAHHDGGHAGATVRACDLDAIGRGVEHAFARPDRVVHFAGRDILALPAEGITDTIDKMEKALVVEPHQVAGAEPGIAFRDYVTQNLPLGLGFVGIALEAAAALISSADAADGFANLTTRTGDAQAIVVAQRNAGPGVDPDDRGRETMREQRRNAADRAHPALDIVE